MIAIKIECTCGQRYAFEVEPVDGRMPHTVTCPACNADGTGTANALIAQQLANAPITISPAAPKAGLRLQGSQGGAPIPTAAVTAAPSTPAPAHRPTRLPGQLDRDQALNEARAKMMWGDEPQQVRNFLTRNGYSPEEAEELVGVMRQERVASLRSDGLKKIFTGIGLALVPVAAWIGFTSAGYISFKLMALAVMVGLYGAYQVVQGTFMLVAPKAVRGDAAEQ